MVSLVGNPSGAAFGGFGMGESLLAVPATEGALFCCSAGAESTGVEFVSAVTGCGDGEVSSVVVTADARCRYRNGCSFCQPKYPAGAKTSTHRNTQNILFPRLLAARECCV